ncbi:hypothetical protein ACQKPC_24550 [Pseudomonas sp. NPDC089918]
MLKRRSEGRVEDEYGEMPLTAKQRVSRTTLTLTVLVAVERTIVT